MKTVLILLALLAPLPALGAELKIATWNLNWLTTRPEGAPGLPADVKPRSDADLALLAGYAKDLNADVVAIEEVDGFQAASKVFSHDLYSIHMTRDHVVQRVGIAVRRGLHYDINPDLTALSDHYLRSGADITLHLGTSQLRILAVHLKKGCRDIPMPRAVSRSCTELRAQIGPLADWIAARSADGQVECFDVTENEHREHILKTSRAPAAIPDTLATQARDVAQRIANALN
ncbi:phosphoribosylaminoimidazole carboxylase ATPase subunit [mine drainage metagenome]|uniref:Phosphoribosylaminoimidazole carboxylase ATPase subunit n=1 Tax=mine drainage metagenome TaxID=410659 RepID=A0A1J5PE76_9ZZZZ